MSGSLILILGATAKLSGEKLRDYEDLKSNSADDGSGNAVTMYLNKLKPQMVELFEQLNFNRYRFWAILVLASVCDIGSYDFPSFI